MKTAFTRQGSEVRLLGYAAGSDKDSVWAHRMTDGALRCYYLFDILLPDGVAHVSALLPSLEPIDKQQAQALISKS